LAKRSGWSSSTRRERKRGHIDRSETFGEFLAKDGLLAETEEAAPKEIAAGKNKRKDWNQV
jgi:hypothetical protein